MDTAQPTQPQHHAGVHYCQVCGQPGDVRHLLLVQRTGMLFSRLTRKFDGNMCKGCASKLHKKVQVHNLFLAWWGTISFCLAPFTLLANTGRYIQYRRSF